MPEVWSDPEFIVLLLVVAGSAGAALRWLLRLRARGSGGKPVVEPKLGAALALALDGDLEAAQAILEGQLRTGARDPDLIVGFLALLRSRGELRRAERIADRLARKGQGAWLAALRVRLAMDAGDLPRAAELALEPEVPAEVAVAALARAHRFDEALALFHRRTPRRERDAAVEATLLAGVAASAASTGGARAARKRLKRGLSVDPEALLVAAVAAIHGREAEQRRAREVLARRAPRLLGGIDGGAGTSEVTLRARELFASGAREAGLRELRTHLDAAPEDWPVRCEYWRWLLEDAQPSDWRSEIEDLLSIFSPRGAEGQGCQICGRCGHRAREALFVCPRCDAFDRHRLVEEPPERVAGVDDEGARITGILGSLAGIQRGEPPGSSG